jgi:uncharacterized protein (DUF1810 family)
MSNAYKALPMNDEYDLRRFVLAQDRVYDDALGFLRRGMMCSPYMEFMFPRLLSYSDTSTARHFAIASLDEAAAYIASPVLGGRYRQCVGTLQRLSTQSASSVFGDTDAEKLHASLTLFSEASKDEFLLETMFDVWFEGLLHEQTMTALRSLSAYRNPPHIRS